MASSAKDRIARLMCSAARGLVAGAEHLSPPEPIVLPKVRPGTIIPADLGPLGNAVADRGTLVLEAIVAVQGERTAADAAAGYAEAYARFALCHPDAFE